VLIFIHGGFWRSLDAATFGFVGGAFAPKGALVAVLDFPMIPAVRMEAIIAQVREAIVWLARHAAAHGGDPGRIHVGGHSSGGHLAVLALDAAWQHAAGLAPGTIRGGLAVSGVFELEPLALSFQQDVLGFTAQEVARFSPLRHVPAGAAPLIVAVAGAETQEFVDQSLEFAAAWAAAGNAATTIVAAGANHIDILTGALADPAAPLHRALAAQLGLTAPPH
jgi:arylformamidase